MNEPADLQRLLRARRWAVVGLSPDPSRASHGVAAFLLAQGKDVVGVTPRAEQILGVACYPTLADVPGPVDVVDVFRRSSAAGQFVDEAVALGAGGAWLQLGVVDDDAAARGRAAGLTVVQDTCPKIEWGAHGPR